MGGGSQFAANLLNNDSRAASKCKSLVIIGDGMPAVERCVPPDPRLVQAMRRLFTGVKMTLADETGDDARLDRRDMAAGIALPNQVIGQTVQGVKGGGATIRPAGAVHRPGFPIQKAGREATAFIFGTDAFGASERLVFGFQHVRCKHLRHDDALAMEVDETEPALSRMNNSCIM
ncbi:hypothetical protein BN874_830042 [Candidatus Contendobacter odensis Run_B_J11]|uniref:Uncharacterized protein n=1 Tax=Candidatus Contendobacter odensis Run_B_J11 TaxID=1400861 RepID=A0A7U7GFK2_9GAMM|nr:hypothetical protein BN874_830042 [Candidatus Contendobacter odensis Run_B_J11]